MRAIRVYADEETERAAKEAAKADGRSVSQWVIQLIRKALASK
jgi:predicted HicB family RNase H-like nuclease